MPIPGAIRLARVLLLLNAAIWLVFGLLTRVRPQGLAGLDEAFRWILAGFMAANAALFLASAIAVGLRRRAAWYFVLAVLVVNIVFTFTDQVGFFDLATFALDALIVALLVLKARWYRPKAQG
jgi:Na+-transporting NADH:ubiquinone oxidoreductase subunit NqrB